MERKNKAIVHIKMSIAKADSIKNRIISALVTTPLTRAMVTGVNTNLRILITRFLPTAS